MVHFEKEGTHFGKPRIEIHDFLILLAFIDLDSYPLLLSLHQLKIIYQYYILALIPGSYPSLYRQLRLCFDILFCFLLLRIDTCMAETSFPPLCVLQFHHFFNFGGLYLFNDHLSDSVFGAFITFMVT